MRGENLRQLAVIERLIFGIQETECETARTESPQEDAQHIFKQLELQCRTSLSIRCRIWGNYFLLSAPAAGNTSQSIPRKFLSWERSFSIQHEEFFCSGRGNPAQEEEEHIQSTRRITFGHIMRVEPCARQSQ